MAPSLSFPLPPSLTRSHVEYSLTNEPKKYKLVFLGDSNVGKTSIISRFAYDIFEEEYQATIGIDFLSKTVYLENRSVRLHLWDTAGQERFRSLIPSYIRDCDAAIVVFDISNRASFDNVDLWLKGVISERGSKVKLFLVGSKKDADPIRQVGFDEAEKKAQFYSAQFSEVSALTNLNISSLFKEIATVLPVNDDKTTSDSAYHHHHTIDMSTKTKFNPLGNGKNTNSPSNCSC